MWAKRMGAIVAAVALITGGLLVRRALDDDGEEAEAATTEPPAGATTVVCIPELVAACQAMAAADSTLAVDGRGGRNDLRTTRGRPLVGAGGMGHARSVAQMVANAVALAGEPDPFAFAGAVAVSGPGHGRPVDPHGCDRRPLRWHDHLALRRATTPGDRGPTSVARRPGGC